MSEQIQTVTDKLQQLVKQYNALQKDNQRLTKENQQLKEKYDGKSLQAQQLQQQLETLKLTSVGLNDDVKKDLEKRISGYLKEIDKCLNLLNAQNV